MVEFHPMDERRRVYPTPIDIEAIEQLLRAEDAGKTFSAFGDYLWIQATSEIKRFSVKPEMIHRTDLWTHVRRTAYLANVLSFIVEDQQGDSINGHDVFWMGMHHDDAELIGGDIPTPVKWAMTPEQREELRLTEDRAIEFLAKFFGHADPERYKRLHYEAQAKESLPAQIVDVADKLDGLGETLHEIRCGNDTFLDILDNYWQVFGGFEGRAFWRTLKQNPALSMYLPPTRQQALAIPKITPEDLSDKNTVWEKLLEGPMPSCYRTWLKLSLSVFNIRPEKYLLPGWYIQLWQRWGYPQGTTTLSGIQLPK